MFFHNMDNITAPKLIILEKLSYLQSWQKVIGKDTVSAMKNTNETVLYLSLKVLNLLIYPHWPAITSSTSYSLSMMSAIKTLQNDVHTSDT